MIRSYELMLVLDPKVEVTEKSALEIVEKLLGAQTNVAEISLLGKKDLAYPLKKQTQGVYVLAKLKGHVNVHEVEKKMQMGEAVLRYLLTSVN